MMRTPLDAPAASLALLEWLIELGADEAIGAVPVNRFELAARPAPPQVAAAAAAPVGAVQAPQAAAGIGPDTASARALAAGAADLDALRAAITAFDGCALKRGARSTVFADGQPGAHVMVVGEAPGREEDREGRPFVGRSGQLLDRMLAAIGLARTATDPARAVYITNVLPWRPPENRDPSADEVAMMTCFLLRHIELAAPRLLLLMGRSATTALIGGSTGITRMRGTWGQVLGRPALPTFHPAALLRNPVQKREVWADLLSLSARLGSMPS